MDHMQRADEFARRVGAAELHSLVSRTVRIVLDRGVLHKPTTYNMKILLPQVVTELKHKDKPIEETFIMLWFENTDMKAVIRIAGDGQPEFHFDEGNDCKTEMDRLIRNPKPPPHRKVRAEINGVDLGWFDRQH